MQGVTIEYFPGKGFGYKQYLQVDYLPHPAIVVGAHADGNVTAIAHVPLAIGDFTPRISRIQQFSLRQDPMRKFILRACRETEHSLMVKLILREEFRAFPLVQGYEQEVGAYHLQEYGQALHQTTTSHRRTVEAGNVFVVESGGAVIILRKDWGVGEGPSMYLLRNTGSAFQLQGMDRIARLTISRQFLV